MGKGIDPVPGYEREDLGFRLGQSRAAYKGRSGFAGWQQTGGDRRVPCRSLLADASFDTVGKACDHLGNVVSETRESMQSTYKKDGDFVLQQVSRKTVNKNGGIMDTLIDYRRLTQAEVEKIKSECLLGGLGLPEPD